MLFAINCDFKVIPRNIIFDINLVMAGGKPELVDIFLPYLSCSDCFLYIYCHIQDLLAIIRTLVGISNPLSKDTWPSG